MEQKISAGKIKSVGNDKKEIAKAVDILGGFGKFSGKGGEFFCWA